MTGDDVINMSPIKALKTKRRATAAEKAAAAAEKAMVLSLNLEQPNVAAAAEGLVNSSSSSLSSIGFDDGRVIITEIFFFAV